MFFIYFIPLFNAIFGFLIAYFFLNKEKHRLNSKIQKYLHNDSLAAEVSPLLDKKLENLIAKLKLEMPMASLFLSGAFMEKMKGKAADELMEILPEIKEKFLKKITEPSFLLSKRKMFEISLLTALIGFLIGFFPLLFLIMRA